MGGTDTQRLADTQRRADTPRRTATSTSPGSSRSLWIVIGCVLSSVGAHGVAYAVLRQIPRPAAVQRDNGPIYQPRREKKKPHRIKVVKRQRRAPVKPRPAALRPVVTKRRVLRKLRPLAPPPMAVVDKPRARAMAPPPLDLTPSAGVNSRLTAGSGAGGYQIGSTALGDPTVAPNGVKRKKRAPGPAPRVVSMGPPSAPAPVAVYLKRLPKVVTVPRMPYPAAAKKKGIQGTVKLLVTIGPSGRAVRVLVLRGLHHSLDRLAVRALKRARFQPALGTDGRPMTYTIRYRYVFRLAT